MKSISEFIMEQENISCDNYEIDSSYIKEFAEYQAACSLVDCYTEQLAVMEFAEENGISSLNIITEADNEKKDNIFKKAGRGIKFVWGKLMNLIHIIAGKIKSFFTHKKAKKKVNEIKDEVEELSKTTSAGTSMEEIINRSDNNITQLTYDVINTIGTISNILGEILHLLELISGELTDTKDGYEHREWRENGLKSGDSFLSSRIKDLKDKAENPDSVFVSFESFERIVNDTNDHMKYIDDTCKGIEKHIKYIKDTGILEQLNEHDIRYKTCKPYFDRCQKEYNDIIKSYDKLLKVFNEQKAKTEKEIETQNQIIQTREAAIHNKTFIQHLFYAKYKRESKIPMKTDWSTYIRDNWDEFINNKLDEIGLPVVTEGIDSIGRDFDRSLPYIY